MSQRNIIVFSDWFYPAYKAGGPITSLNNLVKKIENKVDVSVVTSAYDLGESKILRNIVPDTWQKIDGARIKYLTDASHAAQEMDYKEYDIIYLNSMFSLAFTLKPLLKAKKYKLLKRVILAPRGMLAEGALSLKSFKKKIYLKIFKYLGFHKKINFHATSEQEALDLKQTFGSNVKIKLMPNIPSKPLYVINNKKKYSGKLKLISISRIAPEKNIIFLLNLLSEINFSTELDIYGMVKTREYLSKCQKIIDKLPIDVIAKIHGEIPSNSIKEKFKEAEFFILPTLGENFGHAIYEALTTGTPVIISDKTPWKNLEQHKAGWDIPLNNKGKYLEVLNKCNAMDQNEYNKWSDGAFNYAKKYYEENDPTEDYLKMFNG